MALSDKSIITSDQQSPGGIKNLAGLIAAQSKGLQVESVMYMTSRALQSLQNQINQLLNSAKATALAAENQPTAAAVYVYDKTLGAGVNTEIGRAHV